MNIPLSKRLQVCAGFVATGDRVADIGCDHGYLSIYLLKNGIASAVIAADINEMPLQSARDNARRFGVADKIRFYLSDGVKNIPQDFDTLVCAGMGADTMISILSDAPWLQSAQYRLILQCQSKNHTLRRFLSEQGWEITNETVLRDGRFLYTVMEVLWNPGAPKLTAGQWYFSPALRKSSAPEVTEYYERLLFKLRRAVGGRGEGADPNMTAALTELENCPSGGRRRNMTTVNDILRFIESLAPPYMKEDWDRVGLNCGHPNKPVTTVLVALDPFEDVCQEALEIGAELIVTHHALIWTPGFITDDTAQGKNTLFLIENGIACINAHTNLDCAPGGVNDILAKKLGLEDIRVIAPKGTDSQGREYGLLRQGTVDTQSLSQFLTTVKKNLGCQGLRYVDGGKSVSRVAVGGGACAGEMRQAAAAGCDTFVTADVRYNQFWDAKELGLNLIDAGHFHTENPVCGYLTEKLREAFPELNVAISAWHMDCANFF